MSSEINTVKPTVNRLNESFSPNVVLYSLSPLDINYLFSNSSHDSPVNSISTSNLIVIISILVFLLILLSSFLIIRRIKRRLKKIDPVIENKKTDEVRDEIAIDYHQSNEENKEEDIIQLQHEEQLLENIQSTQLLRDLEFYMNI